MACIMVEAVKGNVAWYMRTCPWPKDPLTAWRIHWKWTIPNEGWKK